MRRRRARALVRGLAGLAALAAGLVAAPSALADTPFGLSCGDNGNLKVCNGSVKTFDGVPLDLTVTFPASAGPKLPLVVVSHGWGGHKVDFGSATSGVGTLMPWAERGYVALGISARGFGNSCGSAQSRAADPQGCEKGWVHLDDPRYELRDIQYLAGKLADQGIVSPLRIGLTGTSYGGGVSLEGAVLRDRIMNPDGTLSAWRSPAGTPMRVAATAPLWPWSDLVYSLTPNGRTNDFTITSPTDDLSPSGVLKESFVAGLYALGQATGYYAPPGADPGADLTPWYAEVNAGEPYDGNPLIDAQKQEIAQHHSPYYLPNTEAPAPTLLENGWTDDLFPVDEALRFYNRTRAQYPGTPLAVIAEDVGHQRGQNKSADVQLRDARVFDWFARYVKGDKSVTPLATGSVEALTEACGAPSAGPFITPNWVAQHPGEVRFDSAPGQTFTSAGGDPNVARTIDPIAGGGACATASASDEPDTANWSLPAATGNGYTLLGAPTVIADVAVSGEFPEVAERLWDVGPDGNQTLVGRGLYRPDASGRQVFQLHPGAWHFAAGHVPKLQLLGRDAPYGRASNGTFSISVSNLQLRLPVHESADGSQVLTPLPPPASCGAQLAPDVRKPAGCGGHPK